MLPDEAGDVAGVPGVEFVGLVFADEGEEEVGGVDGFVGDGFDDVRGVGVDGVGGALLEPDADLGGVVWLVVGAGVGGLPGVVVVDAEGAHEAGVVGVADGDAELEVGGVEGVALH